MDFNKFYFDMNNIFKQEFNKILKKILSKLIEIKEKDDISG